MSNTLELNEAQITLPDGLDVSSLTAGSTFPVGSIYKSNIGNLYIIPNNAVYLGTSTTYNGNDAVYIVDQSNVPVYRAAGDASLVQYANNEVYIGLSNTATQYTTKLVINNTASSVNVPFNSFNSGILYNHTTEDVKTNAKMVMPVGESQNFYPSNVKAGGNASFSGCINAEVSLAANTELYCTMEQSTVAYVGTYTADETTDVTHLNNATHGLSDDINSNASTTVIYNYSGVNITPFVLASSSGAVLNKSNTPILLIDGATTYELDELCEAYYNDVTTVMLYPGNKMTSDGIKVTIETIDPTLIPTESNNSNEQSDSSAKNNTKEAAKDAKKMEDANEEANSDEIGCEVAEDVGDDIIEKMAEDVASDIAIDCVVDLLFLIFV